jgi:hypothetical protein
LRRGKPWILCLSHRRGKNIQHAGILSLRLYAIQPRV